MIIGSKIETIYGTLTYLRDEYYAIGNRVRKIGVDSKGKEYEITDDILVEEEEEDDRVDLEAIARAIRVKKGDKGDKGDPGKTPIAGIDYYSKQQVAQLVENIRPKKGKDYFTKKEISDWLKEVTPIHGKDYFDGKTPIKGEDYFTEKEIVSFVNTIAKKVKAMVKDGDNGEKGSDGKSIEYKWEGTRLFIRNEGEEWGEGVDLQGINTSSGGGGIHRISDATDVDSSTATDGQTLIWNDSRKVWENSSGGSGDFKADGSVPMTGDLNLNGNDLNNVNSIQFDTDPTEVSPSAGLLQWNSTEGTLDLGITSDVTQQIGQELFVKVINKTGSTITNGSAVYFSGRQGNRPKIALAKADSEATSMVMGITTQDIEDNKEGYITTFGYVRQIKTDYATWTEGQKLYVSKDTAGAITNVEPTAPHHSDVIGEIAIVGGAGIGSIFVSIGRHKTLEELSDINGTALTESGQIPTWNETSNFFDFDKNINDYVPLSVLDDDKNPTGWLDGDNITTSYSYTNRTITLTHPSNLYYYWRGVKKELGTAGSWTSSAHADSAGKWFLSTSDGTNFTWSNDPWSFDAVMTAYVSRGVSAVTTFGVRETHGLMDYKAHEELHQTIGTYLTSGGTLTTGTYAVNTASDVATTPSFELAVVKDEDNSTTIPAWSQGTYTTMYIGASNTAVFDTTATFPFISDGSFIQVNNITTGALANGVTNRYYNVYQILMPVTSDSDSQKFRMIFLQPQAAYTSLSAAISEDVRSLGLGNLASLSPEFTIHARITYVTSAGDANTGKVRIATGGVTYNTGTKAATVSVAGYIPTDHENLVGLQGGTAGEHYHMTLAQNTVLANTSGTNTGDNATNTQYSGLATSKEDVANKSTSVATDGASDTKYPSVKAIKDYADGLVAGLLDYRGGYDASVNTFPASGGSGTAGAVLKGDMWVVSVAGTLGGTAVQTGDSLIAAIDTPGQTAGNWNILNGNISYVPEDTANKVTSISGASTDTQYPSAKLVYDQLASKAPLVSPSFTTPSLGVATATSINGATILSGTLNGSVTGTNTGDQTLPVKASKAEAAAGTDDAKFLTALSAAELFSISEGTVLNGKIAVSVSSNDLIVALKGKDGNDPSATNPVYAMIGGALRTITSALSVTAADGTNWCNSGSAELATKEVDYFAYLGYNATDGVVIGFSRIPSARQYSDFSTTSTNQKFCKISTITNAASTDYYNVIGRFAATLSAGAGYTWTVPTFTAINLIQRPIYETRWLNFYPTLSGGGSMTISAQTVDYAQYKVTPFVCSIALRVYGTTAGTANNQLLVQMPFTEGTGVNIVGPGGAYDTSTVLATVQVVANTNDAYFIKFDNSNWGIGASKYCFCYMFYTI